ncbi:MAG TPA: hypothetical protein DDW93_02985, partial [Firmicutes bacterium]|nr:hypothetical protein [Bacillota bacterium]
MKVVEILLGKDQDLTRVKCNPQTIFTLIGLTLISVLFLYPFFLVLINSLKTYAELLTDVFSLPTKVEWRNYPHSWRLMDYPRAFLNTFYVTIV